MPPTTVERGTISSRLTPLVPSHVTLCHLLVLPRPAFSTRPATPCPTTPRPVPSPSASPCLARAALPTTLHVPFRPPNPTMTCPAPLAARRAMSRSVRLFPLCLDPLLLPFSLYIMSRLHLVSSRPTLRRRPLQQRMARQYLSRLCPSQLSVTQQRLLSNARRDKCRNKRRTNATRGGYRERALPQRPKTQTQRRHTTGISRTAATCSRRSCPETDQANFDRRRGGRCELRALGAQLRGHYAHTRCFRSWQSWLCLLSR